MNLLPRTIANLAEIGNIVAIKESSGNMDQISELRMSLPDRFPYTAKGRLADTADPVAGRKRGYQRGLAPGWGDVCREMVNAFISGNVTLAKNIHLELYPFFKGIFITTNPVPIKCALNMAGWPVGA